MPRNPWKSLGPLCDTKHRVAPPIKHPSAVRCFDSPALPRRAEARRAIRKNHRTTLCLFASSAIALGRNALESAKVQQRPSSPAKRGHSCADQPDSWVVEPLHAGCRRSTSRRDRPLRSRPAVRRIPNRVRAVSRNLIFVEGRAQVVRGLAAKLTNDCSRHGRTGGTDPKGPAAVFSANDRTTLDLRSRRRDSQRRRRSFEGGNHRPRPDPG
jgi:hypothetical protein